MDDAPVTPRTRDGSPKVENQDQYALSVLCGGHEDERCSAASGVGAVVRQLAIEPGVNCFHKYRVARRVGDVRTVRLVGVDDQNPAVAPLQLLQPGMSIP